MEYSQARQKSIPAHLSAHARALGTSYEKVKGAWLKKEMVFSLTDSVQVEEEGEMVAAA